MEPPLYFLAPSLAASILQYRFRSLAVEARLARLFGYGAYNGTMAAWTAAYLGNAFGCCGYVDVSPLSCAPQNSHLPRRRPLETP
jgi:hypothetical protein